MIHWYTTQIIARSTRYLLATIVGTKTHTNARKLNSLVQCLNNRKIPYALSI